MSRKVSFGALPLPDVRKIALLRANALGDFIFALPAIKALKEAYPQAEIIYLGKEWHRDFLPGRVPEISRAEAVPPYPGVSEPEGSLAAPEYTLDEFFARMQAEKFDLALQMHGGGRNSNPFLLRLGARRTAGLRDSDAPRLDINIPYFLYQNEVLRLLEVVARVGAKPGSAIPRLVLTENDRQEAVLKILARQKKLKYAVLHPGATDERRRWPPENFVQIANELLKRGFRVFVTGTEEEREVVEAVASGTNDRAEVLCNALSVGGLAGLLAEAELVVSNDTGPLHLASAVGAKSVGIYWIGNLVTAGQAERSRHRPLISWTTFCPVCGRSCVSGSRPFDDSSCRHQVSFVTDVTVSDVWDNCLELLQDA